MATITHTIGTDSRNYSTIAGWVSVGLPPDIVASGNSYIGVCYNDSEFTDSSVYISSRNTDATHTITLTVAAGHSFMDHASKLTNPLRYDQTKGVGISGSPNYDVVLGVSDDYVTVTRLQMRSNEGHYGTLAGNGKNCIFSGLIIEGMPYSNSYPVVSFGSAATGMNLSTWTNSVVIAMTAAGSGIVAYGSMISNVTVVKPSNFTPSGQGVRADYSDSIVHNCMFFGYAISDDSGPTSNGYNITDLTTNIGTTANLNSQSYSAQFVNTTSAAADFRLKAGATAINAGLTNTTILPSADDIVGTARPQGASWDIGAWEYVSAAAPAYRPRVVRWA